MTGKNVQIGVGENQRELTIREIEPRDILEVASIHRAELPDDLCALLGQRFLERVFYPELLHNSDAALCADDGVVVGFVFFSSNEKFLRNLIIKYGLRIFWYSLPNLRRAWFWRYAAEAVMLLTVRDDRLRGSELVYIAVSRARQHAGIGSSLTRLGLAELRRRGIRRCWVKTLASTPLNVKFYEKLGFRRLKSHLGRVYLSLDVVASENSL